MVGMGVKVQGSLAVEGEHVFLVPPDHQHRRSKVTGQGLQPGHVEGAGTLSPPPHGHGPIHTHTHSEISYTVRGRLVETFRW